MYDAPMQMQKKVLMIAYFFPPVGGIAAAGSQRTLKFAKYLPHYSWQPIILTVRENSYESYLAFDATLLERVPANTKIIRSSVVRWLTKILELKNRGRVIATEQVDARALVQPDNHLRGTSWLQNLKDAITGFFEIPDGEIGWLLPGVAAGWRAVKHEAVDVIYATGKPWTAHLIGAVLKRLTGKPLVVDFRDPWMTNPFREPVFKLHNRIEAYLERKVVETANIVVTNTQSLKDEFTVRFPRQSASKFVVLLNGFDPEDGQIIKDRRADPRKFTITHTGFLYGKRDPRFFLEAIASLIETQRVDRQKIDVCLVGSVELPYDLIGYLREHRLDDVVRLVAHVPYQESLQYLANSDALLLLQPGTTTQVPSKLFEYIALDKPILAISPRDGATSRLVRENYLGAVAVAEDVAEIASAVEPLYRAWSQGPDARRTNGQAREKFDVKNVTAILSRKFDDLVRTGAVQQ
jgi:glycosyltransferase involved in cell wall biosynthesis